jgi:hypothetical protein
MRRKALRLRELSKHNSFDDCWVVIHGKVYDVTPFLNEHPGGKFALGKLGRAGCDVSEHYDRIGHSSYAESLLAGMLVAELDLTEDEDSEPAVLPMNDETQQHEHEQLQQEEKEEHPHQEKQVVQTPASDPLLPRQPKRSVLADEVPDPLTDPQSFVNDVFTHLCAACGCLSWLRPAKAR